MVPPGVAVTLKLPVYVPGVDPVNTTWTVHEHCPPPEEPEAPNGVPVQLSVTKLKRVPVIKVESVEIAALLTFTIV